MRQQNLSDGWQVLQDVHDNAEKLGLFRPDYQWNFHHAISEWEPIPRLAHLQVLLADQPDFGRALRNFNEHAWWYRINFEVPANAGPEVRLRFDGVDYFCKAWVNGVLVGEHEGYFESFELPVGAAVKRGESNLLVVKVWAPWDEQILPGYETRRSAQSIRNQIKGTYEHCDTFVQRDVNPVGIWRPVTLLLPDKTYALGKAALTTALDASRSKADVVMEWTIGATEELKGVEWALRIDEEGTDRIVAEASGSVDLKQGSNTLSVRATVPSPRLWNTWDHGGSALYRARLRLVGGGEALQETGETFGIRTVSMNRAKDEMSFHLNGERIYIRGTTYFPDVYLSRLHRGRYERDLNAMVQAGVNAVRVHVHVENPAFYEICDRLGLLVLQDSDLNWCFPTDEAFIGRAKRVFSAMLKGLRNHPCIFGWVCMNEANNWILKDLEKVGRALQSVAGELDPSRPTILNGGEETDVEGSGDSHYYYGCLGGGRYTDIQKVKPRFLGEFGSDVPAHPESLRAVPALARRLAKLAPRIAELHTYQYRLLKYQIEYVRMMKYAPCSGYFQFMWIDLCPQSFYGIYDYWGCPKAEGLGGGVRAFRESSAPIGIFMEHLDKPAAIWAVNDFKHAYLGCEASWTVTTEKGRIVAQGTDKIDLPPDGRVRVPDLRFDVNGDERYRVALLLRDAAGHELARNLYEDPFHHPGVIPGYPERVDHELGARVWDA